MNDATNNATKTRGRPFQPGNKFGKGRPKGSRNKTTIALEALIDGEGEEVIRTLINSAKNGNIVAARALLDRLVPPRKERPIDFELPDIETPSDIALGTEAVLRGMGDGSLLPEQAKALLGALAEHSRAIELADLDVRLKKLETGLANAANTNRQKA